MVTLRERQALWLGGCSNTDPFVCEDEVFELKSDLSGWEERTDLKLPKEIGWARAVVLDM